MPYGSAVSRYQRVKYAESPVSAAGEFRTCWGVSDEDGYTCACDFPLKQRVNSDLLGKMLTFFNAQERTVGEFVDLADGTGWNLESISRGVNSSLSALVFKRVAL